MRKLTFTDRVRKVSNVVVVPIGQKLKEWGVYPNLLTIGGVVLVAVGAWQVVEKHFVMAGIIFLMGFPLDALDGATARAYGENRPFGAFLDSTLDRYSDALILGAFALHYAQKEDLWMVFASLVALHGALAVSYTRARAEGLGLECKEGWFTRLERLMVIITSLFLSIIDPRLMAAGVIILAIGTQITALQRILHVHQLTQEG
ncbi:MAG: CDP-alcohol phosphatidyltransferase family protein [Anaerolineae bacterium]|nr:CDP-alcohol phosphatidyltransferase family protein [Anaerolineae bacterium]